MLYKKLGNAFQFVRELRSKSLSPLRLQNTEDISKRNRSHTVSHSRMKNTRKKRPKGILKSSKTLKTELSREMITSFIEPTEAGDEKILGIKEVEESYTVDVNESPNEASLKESYSINSELKSTSDGQTKRLSSELSPVNTIESIQHQSSSSELSIKVPDVPLQKMARLRNLPSDCPVLLRAWLLELNLRKPDVLTPSLEDKILEPIRITALNQRTAFLQKILDQLTSIEFSSIKVSSRGCRCSRREIPELTDLEMDLFLNHVVPPTQVVVMIVHDSRDPDSKNTLLFSLFEHWYIHQHHQAPPQRKLQSRSRSANQEKTDSSNTQSKIRLLSAMTQTAIGGTGACAALTTKLAQYRFVSYDLSQAILNETGMHHSLNNLSLLRHRHGCRPVVGECLIFVQGQLCFVGTSFTGYADRQPTKKQLEKKIIQCRMGLQRGDRFTLPVDFQLT